MGNKKKLIFWLIAIIILPAVCFYFWLMTSNNPKQPERLSNIPKTATWIGGVDEGFWYEIVDIDKDKKSYRFRIYNDYEGDLVMDADFKKDSLCDIEYALNKSILQKINYFSFDKIGMIDNCDLNMIEPAYGGTFAEMDKNIE